MSNLHLSPVSFHLTRTVYDVIAPSLDNDALRPDRVNSQRAYWIDRPTFVVSHVIFHLRVEGEFLKEVGGNGHLLRTMRTAVVGLRRLVMDSVADGEPHRRPRRQVA